MTDTQIDSPAVSLPVIVFLKLLVLFCAIAGVHFVLDEEHNAKFYSECPTNTLHVVTVQARASGW